MKDEDYIFQLLQEIDDDLIEKEVDIFMADVDFDMESIQKKALEKITPPVQKKPKQRSFIFKFATAACVVFMVSAAVSSQAVKNFINASFMGDTMRIGNVYYLEKPVQLQADLILEEVYLGEGTLELTFLSEQDWIEDNNVFIEMDGVRYDVGGYAAGYNYGGETGAPMEDIYTSALFYQIPQQNVFTLVIGRDTYPITLTLAERAQHKDIVYPVEPSQDSGAVVRAQGVEVGAIFNIEEGRLKMSLLTSFDDPELIWDSYYIESPVRNSSTVFKEVVDGNHSVTQGTTMESERTVLSYIDDENGNVYEITPPDGVTSTDVIQFYAPAPTGENPVLHVEKVAGMYKEMFDSVPIAVPEAGTVSLNIPYDLKQQLVIINSIEKIGEDQVKLKLSLNQGSQEGVAIGRFSVQIKESNEYSYTIDGDECEVTATIEPGTEQLQFGISWPSFYFEGHWAIPVQI